MSIRRGSGSGDYHIDASEFSALLNDVKAFERDLGLRIRKNIRDAGKPIVEQMQKAVSDPKSKRSAKIVQVRRKQRTGEQVEERTTTAALVAKGIAFRVTSGKGGGSGRFVSSGKNLPADRKPMFRALNKPKFRHPVFGNRDEWREQAGRPYFGVVVLEEREALKKAISEALDEAAAALGRSRIRR